MLNYENLLKFLASARNETEKDTILRNAYAHLTDDEEWPTAWNTRLDKQGPKTNLAELKTLLQNCHRTTNKEPFTGFVLLTKGKHFKLVALLDSDKCFIESKSDFEQFIGAKIDEQIQDFKNANSNIVGYVRKAKKQDMHLAQVVLLLEAYIKRSL